MRRLYVAIIIILGTLYPSYPATAFLGLSKCERIAKEVKNIELRIQSDLSIQRSGFRRLVIISSPLGRKVESAHSRMQESLNSIWKIGTNNPNCFTNTQKILIRDKEYWWANTWIALYPNQNRWLIYEVNAFQSIFDR